VAAFREGTVVEVADRSERLVRVRVEVGGEVVPAVGFPAMLGPVEVGDRVVVNTTALELDLGTGGDGFLLWNLDGSGVVGRGPGHIIKMRYTPWQTEVLAVEAPESPHHASVERVTSIDGLPVVACGLHSQIAGVAASVRRQHPRAVIAYLMTDGGALPLAWSNLVRSLQQEGFIDITCTVGHAFGGELEAVNVFSGLVASRVVAGADVVIVAMGPGNAGTGTALGFTGIEQGQVLDAVTALQGRPIACLRVSLADQRARHRGLSHHSITALTIGSRARATVAVPERPAALSQMLWSELEEHGISERHQLVPADGGPGFEFLQDAGLAITSMGRSMEEAPEGLQTAAAAGAVAASMISERTEEV
jgi:Protein of unknown function (DUF3866)